MTTWLGRVRSEFESWNIPLKYLTSSIIKSEHTLKQWCVIWLPCVHWGRNTLDRKDGGNRRIWLGYEASQEVNMFLLKQHYHFSSTRFDLIKTIFAHHVFSPMPSWKKPPQTSWNPGGWNRQATAWSSHLVFSCDFGKVWVLIKPR